MDTTTRIADENTPRHRTASKKVIRTERLTHRDASANYDNTPQFGGRSKKFTRTVNLGTLGGCCSCPITSRIGQVEEKLETALAIIAKQVLI